jgi:hypothetical protein
MDTIDIFTQIHGHAPALTEQAVRDILLQDFPGCPVLSIQLIPSLHSELWKATLDAGNSAFVESTLRNDVEMEIIGVHFDTRRLILQIRPR